jgi:hypothetical protein
MSVRRIFAAALIVSLGWPGGILAQSTTATPPPPPPPAVDTDQLPISVDRIQKKLEHAPAINMDLIRPNFRADVFGKALQWWTDIDWLGDQPRLPQPSTPRWHDEFLSMVTPPQARLYGQSNDGELAQLVATSMVQAIVTRALVAKVRNASENRRRREARQEVDDALADWQRQQERPQDKH